MKVHDWTKLEVASWGAMRTREESWLDGIGRTRVTIMRVAMLAIDWDAALPVEDIQPGDRVLLAGPIASPFGAVAVPEAEHKLRLGRVSEEKDGRRTVVVWLVEPLTFDLGDHQPFFDGSEA